MMRGSRWQLVITAATGMWVLFYGTEWAVSQNQEDPPPVKLLHSGWVETVRQGEERVTDLHDSVLFQQEDQFVLADRANFLDQQEKVTLWGNVQGWDPTWRFWSDRVEYFGNQRLLTAQGAVRALNLSDSTYMESDSLRYNRQTGEGIATGSPFLRQATDDSAAGVTSRRVTTAPPSISAQPASRWK